MLLEDIYHCTQSGGGALAAVFPDEITQAECQTMVDYLTQNYLPSLISAGVPEGTRVAHKHGWVTYFGVMYTLGDAGIVYTSDVTGANAAKFGQISIPPELNVTAVYPLAPLLDSSQPALAQALVDFILSPAGQAILAQAGFLPPEPDPR